MDPTTTRRSALGARAVAAALSLVMAGAAPATPIAPDEADIIRLLEQSTWGPNEAAIAAVKVVGIQGYIDKQLATPQTKYTAFDPWPANRPATCVDDRTLPLTPTSFCARDNYTLFQLQREFFENAVTAPDQLRQRVALRCRRSSSRRAPTSARRTRCSATSRSWQTSRSATSGRC